MKKEYTYEVGHQIMIARKLVEKNTKDLKKKA